MCPARPYAFALSLHQLREGRGGGEEAPICEKFPQRGTSVEGLYVEVDLYESLADNAVRGMDPHNARPHGGPASGLPDRDRALALIFARNAILRDSSRNRRSIYELIKSSLRFPGT